MALRFKFKFMNQGLTDFEEDALHQPAPADPTQPAFDLDNRHKIMTPSGIVRDVMAKHPNLRRNGALFNEHRTFGVKGLGVTLDQEWQAQTWLAKATKGDMHYLLQHAGLLTDEIRGWNAAKLTEYMVKVREDRAAMRTHGTGDVGAEESSNGEMDETDDTLVEDNLEAGKSDNHDDTIPDNTASVNRYEEEISTLVSDDLAPTTTSPPASPKQSTEINDEKTLNTAIDKWTGLLRNHPISMLLAIKDQARINIMNSYSDDRERKMSNAGFGGPFAYKRVTYLYDDDGEVLFSYEVQDLVLNILRRRDDLRAGKMRLFSRFGAEDVMAVYTNEMGRLMELVKGEVQDGEREMVEDAIDNLFGI